MVYHTKEKEKKKKTFWLLWLTLPIYSLLCERAHAGRHCCTWLTQREQLTLQSLRTGPLCVVIGRPESVLTASARVIHCAALIFILLILLGKRPRRFLWFPWCSTTGGKKNITLGCTFNLLGPMTLKDKQADQRTAPLGALHKYGWFAVIQLWYLCN